MYDLNRKELGRLIARKREEKGLSQQQVADQVGVSQQSVALWENGSRPRPVAYNKLADLLGLDRTIERELPPRLAQKLATGPSFVRARPAATHNALLWVNAGIRYQIDYKDDQVIGNIVSMPRFMASAIRREAIVRAWSLLQWKTATDARQIPVILIALPQNMEEAECDQFDTFVINLSQEFACLGIWLYPLMPQQDPIEIMRNFADKIPKHRPVILDDH